MTDLEAGIAMLRRMAEWDVAPQTSAQAQALLDELDRLKAQNRQLRSYLRQADLDEIARLSAFAEESPT